jgi:glycosyltransferase involved in cell wall biosynthesis
MPECQKILSQMVEAMGTSPLTKINVEYSTNKGLIQARNESYDRLINMDCEYIAVIHNDMMFAKGMFEAIIDIMDKMPGIGILAAETIKEKTKDTQGILNAMQFKANCQESTFVRGNNHPAIMRVSALLKILENNKVYDENFGKMDNEDTDVLGRLEDAGYTTLVTTKAWGYHQGEASRSANPDAQRAKDFSHARYMEKWAKKGKLPWQFRSIQA